MTTKTFYIALASEMGLNVDPQIVKHIEASFEGQTIKMELMGKPFINDDEACEKMTGYVNMLVEQKFDRELECEEMYVLSEDEYNEYFEDTQDCVDYVKFYAPVNA